MSKNREIKIVVERRSASGGRAFSGTSAITGQELLRGIIPRATETEYLPRRLKKGGWRFFDLGQIYVEGALADVHFTANSNLTIDYPGETIRASQPAATDVAAKAAFYLSRNFSALATDFYKFTRIASEQFYVTIETPSIGEIELNASGGERWQSDDTIRIDADDDISILDIRSYGLFERIFLAEGALRSQGDKVTAEPDPDSGELTDFQLARTADFYLTPSYALPTFGVQGQKTEHDRPDLFYYEDIGGVRYPYDNPYQWSQEIHGNYTTYPRRMFLALYEAFKASQFAVIDPVEPFDAAEYKIVIAIGTWLMSLPGAVLVALITGQRRVETPSGVFTENVSVIEPSPWTYPNADLFPEPPAVPETNNYGNPLQIRGLWFTWATGRDLKAIIKQNNQFYYVWGRPAV